ncbi:MULTISPECIES: polyketide synthase dehydratase domain-containing protein [unclassified Micromonospora]|uniref:polyketide synthase dehydratase domain-containing protein n=1 Tax=unclassified Micromonospora TaxID=2617518 RepID=UPI0036459FEA
MISTHEEPAGAQIGAGHWVRPWSVILADAPGPSLARPAADGAWQVFAASDDPMAASLRRALEQAGVGAGVLVCLPRGRREEQVELALSGAQAVLAGADDRRFVLVGRDPGAAAVARTLHLEAPRVRTTVVHTGRGPQVVARVAAEVAATITYSEVHYDASGVRRVPVRRMLPTRAGDPAVYPLGPGDVLLAVGGGERVTAECALALAGRSGCRLGLIGPGDSAEDAGLAADLARLAGAGVTVRYARADVTDAAQVRRAVAELARDLGPVTAVLYGGRCSEPIGLSAPRMTDVRDAIAARTDGLRGVLAAVGPGRLRLLVTVASVAARPGLPDAVAGEWLAELAAGYAGWYPDCRTLCLQWPAAESSEQPGVHLLHRLLSDPGCPHTVVISGRTEGVATVRYERPETPPLRFVSRPLLWYPGVELVAEVRLDPATDLYLADHRLGDRILMPAVLGMEAMAQVAAALTGEDRVPVLERVRFVRPIVVPPSGATTVRVAALANEDDSVDVVIHSEETGYTAPHFRARLRYGDDVVPPGAQRIPDQLPTVPLDPVAELYGSVLFQGDRFQRLRRCHRVTARHVDAEVMLVRRRWFADPLPGTLLLGDPGMRDALMHGNQLCVPDATLLPTSIDRLYPAGRRLPGSGEVRYCATERARSGDTYIYDVAVRTADGQVVERWEGLRLAAVRKTDARGPWVAPLLGPYLERMLHELTGARLAIVVEPDGPGVDRGGVTTAVARARSQAVALRHRRGGAPDADGEQTVRVAQGAALTLCVAGPEIVGCAVEAVTRRPPDPRYAGLLAEIRSDAEEDADIAAARVRAVVASLGHSGGPVPRPALVSRPRPGWVLFAIGDRWVATFATTVRGADRAAVFALLPGTPTKLSTLEE